MSVHRMKPMDLMHSAPDSITVLKYKFAGGVIDHLLVIRAVMSDGTFSFILTKRRQMITNLLCKSHITAFPGMKHDKSYS